MTVQEALIQRFQDHIAGLQQFTDIPSDWAWWDRKGKKFKKLAELDQQIVQDVLDLYYRKWVQPLEASSAYELMEKLGSELAKIREVIQSLSKLSRDLYQIRDRQLSEVNQGEEAERLNIIIAAVDNQLRDILVHLAKILHRQETESICLQALQGFMKKLLEEPSVRSSIIGVYASGRLLHRTVEEDLIIMIKGRQGILKAKERMIASFTEHLEQNVGKRLVREVLKPYGFKPDLDLKVKVAYNDDILYNKYLGEWQVLYERELSSWEKFQWWIGP